MTDALPWSAEDVARARALWDRGLSVREIGRLLRRSSNGVCGLRKRHGWPERALPVGLASVQRPLPPRQPEPVLVPVAEPVVQMPRPAPLPAVGLARTCQWPGHPWRRPWPFCGAEVVPGRPYCLAHCLVAYTGTTRRLEEAA